MDSHFLFLGFMLYYPCIQELQKDLDGCDGSADWYQDKDEAKVCK